ncbi:MAG: Elongation factor 4, partial [Parcubacteria group bacterium GW2011_GWC2_45_7]
MAEPSHIRNFCIIAHIDHGKSTLADRLLEFTGTVEKRQMREQMLDQMDIERERGITIKLAPVRMHYVIRSTPYILNLIDTPGHVDFTYEVSRSLAAVEGAVLLVDAAQGVQAQTIGNLYLAIEQNLTIIPAVNKIDLPNAEVEKTKAEIVHLLGCKEEDILCVSGKTGRGVPELLEAIVERVPAPAKKRDVSDFSERKIETSPFLLRALVFDSVYDEYRGVVAYVRVFDGSIKKGDKITFMATGAPGEALEVGYFTPKFTPSGALQTGEIGYVVTGLKNISGCRVGDTVTGIRNQESGIRVESLPGYKEVKPMVFAGIFPKEGDEYQRLREAIQKLKLNDAALYFEPERSGALGFGFRCGFLGLLHLEIVEERLRREYGIAVITTVPSVAYQVTKTNEEIVIIKGVQDLPDQSYIRNIEEPWVKIDVVVPQKYIGGVMQLVQEKRGVYINTEYLLGEKVLSAQSEASARVILHYELPLASILVDFYDK